MPKLYNTVTKVYQMVGLSDVNNPVYSTTDGTEIAEPVVVEGYKADAIDGDNDGLIQDGTPFERPEGTELTQAEKVKAVKKSKKSSK
tara:strand:- start:160 stop:420 length:261 start_codon:yes stop_codon:yes gene_type:complete